MTAPRVGPVEWIPPGDLGTWVTLRRMRRLVNEALADPRILAWAQSVTAGATVPTAQVQAIHDWLVEHFVFRYDPADLELLAEPVAQWWEKVHTGVVTGDCDEAATLAAALGKAVGRPAAFRAVATRAGGPYVHVYTLLRVPGRWVRLDVTHLPETPIPPARRVMELVV